MEAKGEGEAEVVAVRSSGRPTVPSNKPSDPAHVMVLASMEKGMSISAACKKHKVWKGTFCRYVAAAVWWCAHAPSGWSSPAPISFEHVESVTGLSSADTRCRDRAAAGGPWDGNAGRPCQCMPHPCSRVGR